MLVTVYFFARARDLAGSPSVQIDLPAGAIVADVRRRLAELYPALAGLLQRSALAVNNEFAEDTAPLPPAAECALLPPVSGG